MNFKLEIFILIILFTACNSNSNFNRLEKIDLQLDEIKIKTISDIYAMSDSSEDTLKISVVCYNKTNNTKFLDLVHEYIAYKLELHKQSYKIVVIINQTLTNEKFYFKIFTKHDVNLIQNNIFKSESCFYKLFEIFISTVDYESIWTLDVTVLNVNDHTNGFNFSGAFLELLYLFAIESDSGFASDNYYKKLQKIAVWLIFEKGVNSEELKVINKIFEATGKSQIYNPMEINS